jgi:hypothetical protein
MLPIGWLSIEGRPHGPERNSKFTWPEYYTLMSLWSISRSPLMIGADLLNSSDSTMAFLTNPEMLTMHPSHGHDMAIVNGISRIGYMQGGKSALWKDENIADSITLKAVRFIEKNDP